MARPLSQVAPEWWDYTTLDPEILSDAAKLTEKSLFKLSRPGFTVHYHETLEDFYLAEALEYVESWQKATADNPVGLTSGSKTASRSGSTIRFPSPRPTSRCASTGSTKSSECRKRIFISPPAT